MALMEGCTPPIRPAISVSKPARPASVIDGLQLFLALGDEGVERLGYRGIERRLFVELERLLPDLRCPLGGRQGAGELPILVILPVGDQWSVEGSLVPRERVRRTEEMPARRSEE